MSTPDILDVLVIGGGPVGACMGALLVQGAGLGAEQTQPESNFRTRK